MAANFQQQMGGPGQMMPQQQQQRHQQQQRQNQNQNQNQNPTQNPMAQIQQMILTTLNASTPNHTGWQAQVLVQERMALIFNVIGSLRLASQTQLNPPNLHKMVDIAIRFEREIFEKSIDKAAYKIAADAKLEQLMERRNQNQAGMQQSIQQQAQAQAQAQTQQAHAMMMNQNNMQGQGQRGMPPQVAQQGYQHLQHQMQASPIPGQHPQQVPMGMSNDGLPQSIPTTAQQQFQMHMQQPQGQQQQIMQARNGSQQLNQQEQMFVTEMANRLSQQTSPEEKNNIRISLQGRMDPAVVQRHQQAGTDLATLYFRNQAYNKVKAQRAQQLAAQNQMQGGQPMQPQRSMNPSPSNGQVLPPTSMGEPNYIGNMENLVVQQQQQGVIAQAEGQMVVPASNLPRNATPQPGNMAGSLMDQRATPNPRSQQQQQMFTAQQMQHQRLQHAAHQQQQQAQVRLNAQAKAQQMGLQGQPGGMGPMPPQQSPAMATLNAPLRTPSQMNNPEAPQINPTSQFDPRFMQQNQRPPMGAINGMNIPGLNPAMIASMPHDQQVRLASMPPDKLNEMVAKWNEQRSQQMALNAQGLRTGMPPQGAQVRQQQTQQGYNQQTAAIQHFIAANPGRPVPPAMAATMTPQQQQILQIQMQRMQQQNQNQNQLQRNGQQGIPPNEQQRIITQMDNTDFPPNLLNQSSIPRGVPPEVKKWGQLKAWISQNPGLGPNVAETVRGHQKIHYQNIMKNKQAQQQQALQSGMMQQSQGGMPMIPPGMAAPVAQMGQNPMQMQNPQGLRLPTQEEIDAARNHPRFPQFATATDDQIRNVLARQNATMNPQQRHPNMMHAPMNGQQRPGPQQPVPNNQNRPQPPPAKQPAPEPVTNATQGRPRPSNARNAGPTSSPAQPAKNLKRASSNDDVQEVPNPNAQQARQQAPPQAPSNFRPLTANQVAQLDPAAKKKYEAMLRANQNNKSAPETEFLKALAIEEGKRPREADISMDQETKNLAAAKLTAILPHLTNVGKAVLKWFQITRDEKRARAFFHAKNRIQVQFKDQNMTQLRDSFSIRPIEIESIRVMLNTIVKDLSEKFPSLVKPENSQPQPASSEPANSQAAQSSIPLNAANLQQQQQQLSKIHQRSNSRSSQAPAAPTSAQPPFQFGANSPHGTPSYPARTTLTQGDLHLPPRKRAKQVTTTPGQGQTTPGSISSPQVGKAVSPEVKRAQAKPALVCPEISCERHLHGFDSQESLTAHTQEDHVKPLEDPLKFATDALFATVGLDFQGNPPKMEETATGMAASGSKQGQTPVVKGEATSTTGTPMNRQVSMNRQGSTTGAKSKPPPKDNAVKSEPKATSQPPTEIPDPWANVTIDPMELQQTFKPFESGAGGAISDMNVYRSITPNDTPESSNSKDGLSEPNSDISDGVALDISLDMFDDNWQPFGPPDLGPYFSNMEVNEDDLKMFDDDMPNFQTWDDLVDPSSLDKPFVFDSSLYLMNVEE